MEITTTKVFEINNKLVIADSIEQAISIYKNYHKGQETYKDVEIKEVVAVGSNTMMPDYEALIENFV